MVSFAGCRLSEERRKPDIARPIGALIRSWIHCGSWPGCTVLVLTSLIADNPSITPYGLVPYGHNPTYCTVLSESFPECEIVGAIYPREEAFLKAVWRSQRHPSNRKNPAFHASTSRRIPDKSFADFSLVGLAIDLPALAGPPDKPKNSLSAETVCDSWVREH
jgi:hypothetical protein